MCEGYDCSVNVSVIIFKTAFKFKTRTRRAQTPHTNGILLNEQLLQVGLFAVIKDLEKSVLRGCGCGQNGKYNYVWQKLEKRAKQNLRTFRLYWRCLFLRRSSPLPI